MELRIAHFYKYFVEKKNIDGSSNGGVWPNDEELYSFKTRAEEKKSRAVMADNIKNNEPTHVKPSAPTLAEITYRGVSSTLKP
jgi:hypothetical protein